VLVVPVCVRLWLRDFEMDCEGVRLCVTLCVWLRLCEGVLDPVIVAERLAVALCDGDIVADSDGVEICVGLTDCEGLGDCVPVAVDT
jgi:hypothetical protein